MKSWRSLCARSLGFVLGLLCFPALLRAQGSPPMITNDPGTPGAGHWELNVGGEYLRTDTSRLHAIPVVECNYGLSETTQLGYLVSWRTRRDDADARTSGIGNSIVTFKWRCAENTEERRAVSVFPQLEFNHPRSSAKSRGLADAGATLTLPVEFQITRRALTFGAELGAMLHQRRTDEWFAGGLVTWAVTRRFALGSELVATTERDVMPTVCLANVGLAFDLVTRGSLLASIGREVRHRDGERTRLRGYVGWQQRF